MRTLATCRFKAEMARCCVISCENYHRYSSSVRLFRIPCGTRPFHVSRRRLWVKAIQRANGNTVKLTGSNRICSAHFVSGEVSMDTDNQDFVPSVFSSNKPSPKKRRGILAHFTKYSALLVTIPRGDKPLPDAVHSFRNQHVCRGDSDQRNSRGCGIDDAGKENISAAGPEPHVNLQDDVSMETENDPLGKTQTRSPSPMSKEEEEFTKEVVTETKREAITSQETSSLNIKLSLASPKLISQLQKMCPVVVLKPVVVPKGVQQRDELLDEQDSSDLSSADSYEAPTVHPSFPCNMCDRSFTAIHSLKRHKLLHVKDGRKCLRCGVLFCRRHKHLLFQPRPEPKPESDGSFDAEQPDVDSRLSPENMEPSQITETVEMPPPSPAPTDKSSAPVPKLLPSAPCQLVFKRDGLLSVKPSSVPPPPSPMFSFLRNSVASFHLKPPAPSSPPDFVQSHLPQHPELPPSLQLFSPQYLTSAFLDVQRNYEYVLNRRKTVDIELIVKEESEEQVLICPVEKTAEQAKNEKIAYDLEIIL